MSGAGEPIATLVTIASANPSVTKQRPIANEERIAKA
jgi:hypothetical protein